MARSDGPALSNCGTEADRAGQKEWISPSQVMDMVFDVRAEGCDDVGYMLLRPRSRNNTNTVAGLVRAKLQPVKPSAKSWTSRCGMPITARDYRLILAPKVADPISIERLLDDYDRATRPQQRLLAAVLTMKFDPDMPLHDAFDEVCAFAKAHLARRRGLSSIAVLHAPGDELADAPGHAHVVMLGRRHAPSGFGSMDVDLTDDSHPLWAEEWRSFTRERIAKMEAG